MAMRGWFLDALFRVLFHWEKERERKTKKGGNGGWFLLPVRERARNLFWVRIPLSLSLSLARSEFCRGQIIRSCGISLSLSLFTSFDVYNYTCKKLHSVVFCVKYCPIFFPVFYLHSHIANCASIVSLYFGFYFFLFLFPFFFLNTIMHQEINRVDGLLW